MWAKHKFWEKGINPTEFRKLQMRDIKDILDIDNQIKIKQTTERELQGLIAQMKNG